MTVPVHFQSGGAPKNSDPIGKHSRFYPFRGIQGAANLYRWSEPSPQFATPGSENRVTRRATGNAPRVVQRFADAIFSSIKQDSVAWCAAAVGAMLKRGRPQALGQPRGAVLRGLGRRAGGGDGGRHRYEEAGRLVLRGPVGFVVGADPGPLLNVIKAMRGLSRPSRARRSPRSAGRPTCRCRRRTICRRQSLGCSRVGEA